MGDNNAASEDQDLIWLSKHKLKPGEDTLQFETKRVESIFNYIKRYKKDDEKDERNEKLTQQLPVTIGLLGGWGSGKTTFLAYLTEKLEQDNFSVIYFNAWKYAGFREVFPALVYKILKNIRFDSNSDEEIVRIGKFLVSKYSEHIGTWTKNFVGINLLDLYQDVKDVINKSQERPFNELLKQYYTQIDQIQEQLSQLFKHKQSQKPIVVLIDELDRCDPGEAFEVIKQLRILFAMPGIPLIFVLSANPDPIGLAIKHQYGLNTKGGEYEAKRILEKFVDSYIDMSAPTELNDYVEALWETNRTTIDNLYVQKIDTLIDADIMADRLKNAKVLNTIRTSNLLYSNLRVLKKSFDYISSAEVFTLYNLSKDDFSRFHWTVWHLEILKQVDSELRHKVSKIGRELKEITKLAYLSLFKECKISSPNLNKHIKLNNSEEGNTAFSKYRSYFWHHAKKVLDAEKKEIRPQNKDVADILTSILADVRIMEFIINLSLFPISDDELDEQSWEKDTIKLLSTYKYLLEAY